MDIRERSKLLRERIALILKKEGLTLAVAPLSHPKDDRDNPTCPRCGKKGCPAAKDWHEHCESDDK